MSKEKIRDLWRPALIILLLFTALLLVRETGYYTGLTEKLHAGGQTGAVSETVSSAAASETAKTVHPLAVMVCEENGEKSASAYDGSATEEAFGRFSAFLGEALGSAGEPQQIYERDFRSGMDAGCVVFTFHCPQNLGLLSRWLGTEMNSPAAESSAGILYLRLFENEILLCYQAENGFFYRCSTAAQCDTLRARLQGFQGKRSDFAYQNKFYANVSDYAVILEEMPVVYGVESAGASDSVNPGELMELLGMNHYVAASYRETDGTTVYIDADKTLRIGADRSLSFFDGSAALGGTAVDEKTAVSTAFSVAERSIRKFCGNADIYFSGVEYVSEQESYIVFFDYCVNEIPVCLRNGHAAEVIVQNGAVAALRLNLLRFTLKEEAEVILPMPQAAAIVSATGGGMPRLVYAEGTDGLHSAWVNG